jgi:hypothetical protein
LLVKEERRKKKAEGRKELENIEGNHENRKEETERGRRKG